MVDERELPERFMALRGMDRILPAIGAQPSCYLVGGAVRDLLLGREPVDVDVAVDGGAEAVAARVATAFGGEVVTHERFGTATVVADGVDVVNFARTRRETYPEPGALPVVEPAGLDEDLGRRDFTINAIAVALGPDELGTITDRHGGRTDLRDGLVRVLHPASFSDDPTRLLRAARYAARLGFRLDDETDRLARAAVADGALATVSGSRIRDELIDLLAEDEAPAAVALLGELGLDRALHPGLHADAELVASAKLAAAETGADTTLVALAALLDPAADGISEWVDRLGLAAADRDAVLRAAQRAPALVGELRSELCPSELHTMLAPEPPEALALALALGAPGAPVLDYVTRLSGTRLEIDGADLLAAGVPESPALGRALAATLARKLDGEVAGRDDELRVAVELARGEGR